MKYETNCGTEEVKSSTISEMQQEWSELVRGKGILLLLPAPRCQLISTNFQHSAALAKKKSQLQPAFRAHLKAAVHCSNSNTAVHWSIMKRWECTGRPVTTIHWLVSLLILCRSTLCLKQCSVPFCKKVLWAIISSVMDTSAPCFYLCSPNCKYLHLLSFMAV